MEQSLVTWDGGEFISHCGYCGKDGSVSTGLTSSSMTAHDYQNLVDRGWRRCGFYLYKPNNKKTCCPLYTIRCDAVNLQLSKSQKKVLRRFNAFLMNPPEGHLSPRGLGRLFKEGKRSVQKKPSALSVDSNTEEGKNAKTCVKNVISIETENSKATTPSSSKDVDDSKKREGDDSKPKCKKAKLMRLERRKAKMEKKGISVDTEAKRVNEEKTLEDYINEVTPENCGRKLEITLVRSVSNDATHDECFKLYQKYQKIIHFDLRTTFKGYKEFLMDSSLNEIKKEASPEDPPCGYGTFHQLYRLDGKLIAVGVLDILPRAVSSVYFFYDPDFIDLNLGTYGALRELELTRKFAKQCPSLNQYYLGYYIHSCQKMRYKGQWKPSYLMCPEAYTWHPISECLMKLDKSPYSRFNSDVNAKSEEDDVDVGQVKLWRGHRRPPCLIRECVGMDEYWTRTAGEYALLVGRTAAQNMIFRLSSIMDSSDSDGESNESDNSE